MIDLTGIAVLIAFWWYIHEAFKIETHYGEDQYDPIKAEARRGNPWIDA